MIHGAKDAYIGPEIARQLFVLAGEPKDLWIVPGAKHNRCREVDPDAYAARIESFLQQYAPRTLATGLERGDDGSPTHPGELPATALAEPTSAPVARSAMAAPAGSHSGDLAAFLSG